MTIFLSAYACFSIAIGAALVWAIFNVPEMREMFEKMPGAESLNDPGAQLSLAIYTAVTWPYYLLDYFAKLGRSK